MKKLIVLLFTLSFFASGCAVFTEQVDRAASLGGKGVAAWCANVPSSERPGFKVKIEEECNQAAGGTGCEVIVTCPTVPAQ